MAKSPAQPNVTRKHLARAERERRQRTVILGLAIAVAVIVTGLLLYVLVANLLSPVATVNGEKISTADFRGRIRLTYAYLLNQAQTQDQMEQVQAYLSDPEVIGQSVLNQLIEDVLIRQEVERRGETVTEEEIDIFIAETRGFYFRGTPTSFPTNTPNATMTAQASITPTATEGPTPTISPSNTPGPAPTTMPTMTAFPTPTEYTEEQYRSNLQLELDFLDIQFSVSESKFRDQFRAALYSSKLIEAFELEVPRTQEHVHARHILVESEESAREVLDRLAQGDSFEDLALEFSTDESNKDEGGDLGWFPRGQLVEEFEDAVFTAQIGVIPEPVETAFGWHIIEVLGREDRELDDYSHQLAVQTEYNDWLIEAHQVAAIEISSNWSERIPDPPAIGRQQAQ